MLKMLSMQKRILYSFDLNEFRTNKIFTVFTTDVMPPELRCYGADLSKDYLFIFIFSFFKRSQHKSKNLGLQLLLHVELQKNKSFNPLSALVKSGKCKLDTHRNGRNNYQKQICKSFSRPFPVPWPPGTAHILTHVTPAGRKSLFSKLG